jgi:lysyl-tRNA synthetase class 2
MTRDTWMPSASLEALQHRAKLLEGIRQFFKNRHYLEVETPALSRYGVSDIYLSNIQACFRGETCYLHTSPEYAMKRLLAAGSGPIFQIAKVFRDDELGRWHNPEFTLLEWYQLNINHHQLMDEVDAFLQIILKTPPMLRITYAAIFEKICQINPHNASLNDLQLLLKQHSLDNVIPLDETDRDQYLFLCMSHIIEPALLAWNQPVALYDFPASQAALAKINSEGFAERFEIYYQGIELANGFHELTDAEAQAQRFRQDNLRRKEKGFSEATVDPYFLAALKNGLPNCSGVALGVDRLVALALKHFEIKKIISFDFSHM